ncbi:MAG: hypothetical protein HQ509_05875 [Candidatus Marinimicrobia bacterium]|nr:hypothetical protein [Candidatus Neomarinimicrobiota bacterium]
MKNKTKSHYLRLFGGILVLNSIYTQTYISGSTQTRFGEDKAGYLFTENILDLQVYKDNLNGWVQFEYSRPPEIGRSFTGFRKFRLEYQTDKFYAKFGDIYEIWGRGLILNQTDDQTVDLDNGTRGFLLDYRNAFSETKILHGISKIWKQSDKIANYDARVPNYYMNHSVLGVDESINVFGLDLGLTFLQVNEIHYTDFNMTYDSIPITHRYHGVRAGYYFDMADIYMEYYDKKTDVFDSDAQLDTAYSKGNGFYGNVNLYLSKWSLSMEYKNYDMLRLNPMNRADFVNYYGGYTDFQNAPTAYKEHTSVLLTRQTHQIDPNNELGIQFELMGPIIDHHLGFVINYSSASRNQTWNLVLEDSSIWWESPSRYNSIRGIIPSKTLSANPFEEYYGEINGTFFNDRLQFKVGYDKLWDIPEFSHWYQPHNVTDVLTFHEERREKTAITIPTQLSMALPNHWSAELKYDWQKLSDGKYKYSLSSLEDTVKYESEFVDTSGQYVKYQHSRYFSLEISKSPQWGFVISIDASDVEGIGSFTSKINPLESIFDKIIDIDKKWIGLEILYNISSTTQARLFYGSVRGGLVCSNGICRLVQPFSDGFIFSLNTIF